MVIVSKLVQTAMAMVSLTKIRTMNVNARHAGRLGFVPDDDDHEEVIKTSRVALSVTKHRRQTRKAFWAYRY
jgi:hypothetical protein